MFVLKRLSRKCAIKPKFLRRSFKVSLIKSMQSYSNHLCKRPFFPSAEYDLYFCLPLICPLFLCTTVPLPAALLPLCLPTPLPQLPMSLNPLLFCPCSPLPYTRPLPLRTPLSPLMLSPRHSELHSKCRKMIFNFLLWDIALFIFNLTGWPQSLLFRCYWKCNSPMNPQIRLFKATH